MKKKQLLTLLLTIVLLFSVVPTVGAAHGKALKKRHSTHCISKKEVELKFEMQKAWIDHTIWTRSYIVSAISNLPDQKYVLQRLLQNQQDIGNIIKPFYGEGAGDKLAELLREHIMIAGQIVEAAKTNNEAEVKRLNEVWHKNADDIAKFLSVANPNWTFEELQKHLYTHLEYINIIVVSCLKGDWKADIEATDKNEIHMIHFADILTAGIVKQFPE